MFAKHQSMMSTLDRLPALAQASLGLHGAGLADCAKQATRGWLLIYRCLPAAPDLLAWKRLHAAKVQVLTWATVRGRLLP